MNLLFLEADTQGAACDAGAYKAPSGGRWLNEWLAQMEKGMHERIEGCHIRLRTLRHRIEAVYRQVENWNRIRESMRTVTVSIVILWT